MTAASEPLRARLVTAQGDPEIGAERIAVHHPGGRVEEVALHDYTRVYELPGVYEQIVQGDLGCRSPAHVAQLLADALDALGRNRAATRVIDIAAGNGVSGEALRDAGVHPVLGTDIVATAEVAVRRDRPDVYDEYLTLDLTALTDDTRRHLRELTADALTCVAPVGDHDGAVPPAALAGAAQALTEDALVVTLHDPRPGFPEAVTETFWQETFGSGVEATRHHHGRYLHRFLLTGAPYELDASVWHLRRVK